MDTEVLTEVPVVLKKLVRMIARGFYTMEHAIVVDLLVKHPCIKEDDLADLLKYEKKHLRSLLNTLKNEKFLKSRMRVETDEEGRTTRHSYYFISYNVFVNVVKYKLDHIRKKIELEERTTSSRANFKCQACGKTFTDFEIGQLLDYTTKQLVCTFCEEEVLEDESSLPRADARTSLARFNSQVKPIFDLLQECEEIRLAPDLLEPEPTDFKKMQKNPTGPQQRTKVDDDVDKMAVEKKEVPIWMQKSTVDGVPMLDGLDSLPIGGKDGGPSRLISSTMVPSEDIMQTLLVHEPKAGSSRLPDNESSDESERDGFGAGTAPAGDDEEMESNEEDEAVPIVTIGDKRVPYHDVTEDMVALMTPLEKEEYIRIGQEIYENMYE
ncbi:hypothetical protein C0Q70_11056 [Pomacea canaliculata]|uniref:HTH TFE/IIEalpha-type domain-containing protein n=1 Tax=Pomacea canaliculata TaxID=400727 RepID=A0A2T7P4Y5_POMCA|nr:hypothetical protein C0Q70_11056 [Pomacea canaliculata]